MTERDWSTAEELGSDVLNAKGPVDLGRAAIGAGALTAEELRLLEAISARILPTTHTPGAVEAGAAHYVNFALGGAYRSWLARYQRGLSELQRHCRSGHGMPFEDLGEDRQDTVLSALQAGAIGEIDGGADLFELVRRHVLEGVFCEPNYGGNRDLVGWALVGFPGQRYGYPDPYIDRVIDLPPIAVEGPPRRGDA